MSRNNLESGNDPERRDKRRFGSIFDAINENLKRKDEISYAAQEQRKTAKELAESYKRGSTKISDDATVVEGYQDQGFTLPGQQGRSFGGLIGTGLGAVGGFIAGDQLELIKELN